MFQTLPIWSRIKNVLYIILSYLQRNSSSYIVTLATFAFGITCRGEWVVVAIHLLRQYGFLEEQNNSSKIFTNDEFSFKLITLESLNLQGLLSMWIICNTIGFITYFLIGGFLHWQFYLKRRDRPDEWKCQPLKWLSPELERHEILFGSLSLLTVNTVTSIFATHIKNGGWSTVYYKFDEYSWTWYFLQWPVIFVYQVGKNLDEKQLYRRTVKGDKSQNTINAQKSQNHLSRTRRTSTPNNAQLLQLWLSVDTFLDPKSVLQDYVTYWLHRLYHTPWLYRRFHKAHHRYVQPTAFSVTAIHPVEIVHIQLILALPLFTIPTHWTSFTGIGFYTYYHGIIDHSGIDFKAPWWQPWRPDTIFHDNHHQYFHVNFGFNCYFWDKLHDTYRRTDRIYKEDIFYGKGKPITEASSKEIEEEIEYRHSENPKAHRHINPVLNKSEITLEGSK